MSHNLLFVPIHISSIHVNIDISSSTSFLWIISFDYSLLSVSLWFSFSFFSFLFSFWMSLNRTKDVLFECLDGDSDCLSWISKLLTNILIHNCSSQIILQNHSKYFRKKKQNLTKTHSKQTSNDIHILQSCCMKECGWQTRF